MIEFKNIFRLFIFLIIVHSCDSLDKNPLDKAIAEEWYSNEDEINMSLNDLYKPDFWQMDDDFWTDDYWNRSTKGNAITYGTIDGTFERSSSLWLLCYKAISRSNLLIEKIENSSLKFHDTIKNRYIAEARFVRAYQYSVLISHFGDVVYYDKNVSHEEYLKMSRTDKYYILDRIYSDFDFAADNLPEKYTDSQLKRATSGAALALKARIALYLSDWGVCKDACRALIDSGIYSLHKNYRDLFLASTKNSGEVIFGFPRSVAAGNYIGGQHWLPRNSGGWSVNVPTWEQFASYLCTDGLPIDESPLFSPLEPFKNRDPRCSANIVAFGSEFLGFIYHPHPDSLTTLNVNTGNYQKNYDSRSGSQFASYTGLLSKKSIDTDWLDDYKSDPDKIIIRLADVLLMYAEAKIELGEVDQTVYGAINQVRARAYGVGVPDKLNYPSVSESDRDKLLKILRTERRMEFPLEGLRYMDIIRWGIAEKVLNRDVFGLVDLPELRNNVRDGKWFWGVTPEIDNNGNPVLNEIYNKGYAKLIATRDFDKTKQYLWPIPSKEILINKRLKQNTGY